MNIFFTNIAYASVDSFIGNVNKLIINPLIILLFALALVFFLYGVFEFIANQDKEDKKTAGKQHMLWGIIGLAVMVGVWGILGIVLNTFNLTDVKPQQGEVNLGDYNPGYKQVGDSN